MQKAFQNFIGWDVGGAHLKVALFNANGQLLDVLQAPCALWKGLSLLSQGLHELMQKLQEKHALGTLCHAVTMTGELVDLFDNRVTGVLEISETMEKQLGPHIIFYAASLDSYNFIKLDEITSQWQALASVNWHASAVLLAQHVQTGILVDIGSTTTDIVLFNKCVVQCDGLTDAQRMQTNSLIYTGIVRTPLMAVTQTIMWEGVETSTAAEYFATMADVYRLTGDLMSGDDMADTADGQDKSLHASARRLARMIGHDVENASIEAWKALAISFKEKQKQRIQSAVKLRIDDMINTCAVNPDMTVKIVGAGVGSFLVKEIAQTLDAVMHNVSIEFITISDCLMHSMTKSSVSSKQWASNCLPAVAVAYLAHQSHCKTHEYL